MQQRQAEISQATGTDVAETSTESGTLTPASPDLAQQETTPGAEATLRPRRVRMGRKRPRFAVVPRPAPAVKTLWRAASLEERLQAHQTCMAILEYWLGKKSKVDVARGLSVPPLRVWQLSQLALSGMMAGLLRQPRNRVRVALPPPPPESDPVKLKRRIVELERKLARTEDLVRVLQDLPWKPAREVSDGRTLEQRGKASRQQRTSGRGGRGRRTSAPGAGPAAPGGRTAAAVHGTDPTS